MNHDLYPYFKNEEECLNHLKNLRWGGIVTSPFSPNSKVYYCSNGRYRCYNTGKYFNVKTNTLFHNTRVPLRTWFLAIKIFEKEEVTSVSFALKLGVSQKTAWNMLRRIRKHYNLQIKRSTIGQTSINTIESESGKFNLVEWLNKVQ